MTRLPRDLAAGDLVKGLRRLGYEVTRQSGSPLRLTTRREGEHHVTIPAGGPLKIGTLSSILRDIAAHHGLSREDLLRELFS